MVPPTAPTYRLRKRRVARERGALPQGCRLGAVGAGEAVLQRGDLLDADRGGEVLLARR